MTKFEDLEAAIDNALEVIHTSQNADLRQRFEYHIDKLLDAQVDLFTNMSQKMTIEGDNTTVNSPCKIEPIVDEDEDGEELPKNIGARKGLALADDEKVQKYLDEHSPAAPVKKERKKANISQRHRWEQSERLKRIQAERHGYTYVRTAWEDSKFYDGAPSAPTDNGDVTIPSESSDDDSENWGDIKGGVEFRP